jgi:AraC family transcriptional regulator, transcriptional activator FtrA
MSTTANRNVVTVAYDGLCLFEFGIASELFGLPRPELGVPWYDYRVVSVDPGPVRSLGGLRLSASTNLAHVRRAGTIILPGWKGGDVVPPRPLLDAIRTAHRRGARIMSICSGAYVLAATGLLDGQPATTHWRYVDHFAATFPAIDVRPDVLFIDNGQTLTSAGSAAGIDLGLHLIRRDHGAAVAAQVARRLVMPPQRDGGQAQYIRHPDSDTSEPSEEPIARTMEWAVRNLARPLTLEALARRAHMSTRTFTRHFAEQIGTTPHVWLTTQRVRRAQELLETTTRPLQHVAADVGFGTVENLRHHFRTRVGTSPGRYRATFRYTATEVPGRCGQQNQRDGDSRGCS